MQIEIETGANPDYQRTLDTIATTLVEVAHLMEQNRTVLLEGQRLLQDIARNYRKALDQHAALYIAAEPKP